jgi:hypothetical protein
MTLPLFLTLFAVFSILATALTECIKKMFTGNYSSNIIAAIVSVALGIGGTLLVYYFRGIQMTGINIVCAGIMALFIWMGSMLGYDKIKQMIEQIISMLGK